MKRTTLFLLAATTSFSCLFAQTTKNPFSKLGYKKHVMYTSSKGEFEEFHDNADVVEIGSVYFNTKTNKVVGFIDKKKEKKEVASSTSAMSVDPKCEKYYWITPYAYCLNNPVKFVDPDGKDVVILNAPKGANDQGHMAAIIQDKQGNCYYVNLGAITNDRGLSTLSNMATNGVTGGMIVQSLDTKNIKEAISIAKQDKDNSEYTQGLMFKTTSKMDDKIYESALLKQYNVNTGNEKYNPINNSCADAVKQVIQEGTGVKLPSKIAPSPNSYFEELKNNKNAIQIQINAHATAQQLIDAAKETLKKMENSTK